MEYIIQFKDDKYLNSKFNLTPAIASAARFNSVKNANNFISNNLPKDLESFKKDFKIIEIETIGPGPLDVRNNEPEIKAEVKTEIKNENIKSKKQTKKENKHQIKESKKEPKPELDTEFQNKLKDYYINNTKSIKTINEDIDKLNSDLNNLITSKDFLMRQLSDMDKRISKIYHFVELNDIESPEISVEIVKILKETLVKRRKIKYCLQVIASIETNKPKSINAIKATIDDFVKNLY